MDNVEMEMKIKELERKIKELEKGKSNPVEVGKPFKDAFIGYRSFGEYANKALWLSESFEWEIKRDSDGWLCLIPTKNY